MGKISIFTQEQKKILDQIRKSDLVRKNFYLTGGTALSQYYLQHRYSEDLDFFTETKVDRQDIYQFITTLSHLFKITFLLKETEIAQMFFLKFPREKIIKVDFVYKPVKILKKGTIDNGIIVDSFVDIAVNKIVTVNDRSSVKDFVDLYFILDHFTIWDLIYGAKVKYREEINPWILASDLLEVEKFNTLPKMIKPLTVNELKQFFREKAKQLGKKVIK